jgi:hypothetical protein
MSLKALTDRVHCDGAILRRRNYFFPMVHEPHRSPSLHPSDDDYSDTEADSKNTYSDPEQQHVRTCIHGTPLLDNCLVGNHISKDYFGIFDNEMDLWLPFSCDEEYRLAQCCIEYNMSRAAIYKLFRNPMMATVTSMTSSHTLFKWLNKISNAMGIDSWKSGKVCYNRLADTKNLRNHDYTHFLHRNPVECIEFLLQQPAFREHISSAPAEELNDAEQHIYSVVKSYDWWWNEQLRLLNFVIAMMSLTAALATAATWRYDCPFIQMFRPDTSSKLFARPDGVASIFDTHKYWFEISSNPFNIASIVVSLLSVPAKYHLKEHGKTTAMNEQQIHNCDVLRQVYKLILCPLHGLFNTG